MNAQVTLDQIRIATPCSVPWSAMKGDDRVRFCDACGKHVYNIAAIPTQESLEAIQEAEGRLCVRLHRRRDGTVITADCPVGLREAAARRLRNLVRLAAMITGIWGINAYLRAAATWPYGSIPRSFGLPWSGRDRILGGGTCVVTGELAPMLGKLASPLAPNSPGGPPLYTPAVPVPPPSEPTPDL